ncbi:TPA: hypothetical protein ACTXE4_000268 [Raoultella ornithinolytica]
MTITLQAVNELIQSLESAGELSIRETKVLELAKAYQKLAAENVVLKQIFDSVTDLSNEPQYHSEGMGCGLEDRGITDRYDACCYGWDEAMERVYGEVIPCAEELEFPATDRIVAGIKADGVEMFVEKCREKSKQAISSDIRDNWWLAGEHADDFAKQLREGAK